MMTSCRQPGVADSRKCRVRCALDRWIAARLCRVTTIGAVFVTWHLLETGTTGRGAPWWGCGPRSAGPNLSGHLLAERSPFFLLWPQFSPRDAERKSVDHKASVTTTESDEGDRKGVAPMLPAHGRHTATSCICNRLWVAIRTANRRAERRIQ